MARAGIPVPEGFGIGISALAPMDRAGIQAAYDSLGGIVAIRSSSIAEDDAGASFAGQFESVLGVEGIESVFDAIERCLQSRHSRRCRSYRGKLSASDAGSMGVLVQRFVRADASGVLFTRCPSADDDMLLETARGESSVESGHGVPVQIRIERKSGDIRPGSAPAPWAPVEQIYKLGLQIESVFGEPCDIEWALAAGQVAILQARPITTPSVAEREAIRREEIAAAAHAAGGKETVWVQDNFADGLPAPTPMTWSLLQQLLSADGGFGTAYRDLGLTPDPALGNRSAYDLIAGRPFLNLNRAAQMQFGDLPIGYSIEQLKTTRFRRPVWQSDRANCKSWLGLPRTFVRLRQRQRMVERQFDQFPAQFQNGILPAYLRALDTQDGAGTSRHDVDELLSRMRDWCDLVFVHFGRHFFKPAALADYALLRLRALLSNDSADARIAELLAAVELEPGSDLARGLADLASGKLSESEFRSRFGHRSDCEMELAAPRFSEWSEPMFARRNPAARLSTVDESVIDELPGSAQLWAQRLLKLIALRETAKHEFLRGYAVIRQILLEIDRRLSLDGGIFFLTFSEIEDRPSTASASRRIAERRRRWTTMRSLPMPPELFSDDLERIGKPHVEQADRHTIRGLPLSPGLAEGSALVLAEPDDRATPGPYVLVCPNCDPAWTPLLLNARAAVFECGGVLSHGAIVAREFGVPAVGAATLATHRILNGEIIRVDGLAGTVTRLPSSAGPPPVRGGHSGRE